MMEYDLNINRNLMNENQNPQETFQRNELTYQEELKRLDISSFYSQKESEIKIIELEKRLSISIQQKKILEADFDQERACFILDKNQIISDYESTIKSLKEEIFLCKKDNDITDQIIEQGKSYKEKYFQLKSEFSTILSSLSELFNTNLVNTSDLLLFISSNPWKLNSNMKQNRLSSSQKELEQAIPEKKSLNCSKKTYHQKEHISQTHGIQSKSSISTHYNHFHVETQCVPIKNSTQNKYSLQFFDAISFIEPRKIENVPDLIALQVSKKLKKAEILKKMVKNRNNERNDLLLRIKELECCVETKNIQITHLKESKNNLSNKVLDYENQLNDKSYIDRYEAQIMFLKNRIRRLKDKNALIQQQEIKDMKDINEGIPPSRVSDEESISTISFNSNQETQHCVIDEQSFSWPKSKSLSVNGYHCFNDIINNSCISVSTKMKMIIELYEKELQTIKKNFEQDIATERTHNQQYIIAFSKFIPELTMMVFGREISLESFKSDSSFQIHILSAIKSKILESIPIEDIIKLRQSLEVSRSEIQILREKLKKRKSSE